MTADQRGGSASTPISSLKLEEVVCILKQPESPGECEVFSLEEVAGEPGTSYRLSQCRTPDVPQTLLDSLLVEGVPDHLQSGPSRHIHVVVSTLSGTGLSLAFYESVLRPLLTALGLSASEVQVGATGSAAKRNSYDLAVTQTAASVRDFAHNLGRSSQNEDGTAAEHTVVLLSGDGGVVEMLNGKAPIDDGAADGPLPLVAMLPLGTGNALFNSLHKFVTPPAGSPAPSALVQGLRTLLSGEAAPLPSFKASFPAGSRTIAYAEGSDSDSGSTAHAQADLKEQASSVSHLYGAIVASYGFHSQLVWESDTPEYRKHGDKRFGMVAQELLKESHAYDATVEVLPRDGGLSRKLDRENHAYILATMVSNLEKTFCISPSSRPLDGQLRLVHFGPVGGERTMQIMMQAYDDGKHIDMQWPGEDGAEEKVGYEEIAEVRITTAESDARWRKVCIDGTIVEVPRGGTMTVRKEERPHLQVLVQRSVV